MSYEGFKVTFSNMQDPYFIALLLINTMNPYKGKIQVKLKTVFRFIIEAKKIAFSNVKINVHKPHTCFANTFFRQIYIMPNITESRFSRQIPMLIDSAPCRGDF